jgi:hypothetical protein
MIHFMGAKVLRDLKREIFLHHLKTCAVSLEQIYGGKGLGLSFLSAWWNRFLVSFKL